MSHEALTRLIRVAGIIAKDAKNPDNQARAKEILALAAIIKKEINDDLRRVEGLRRRAP
jgi:uncharacterized protein YutE (UPF0331/DUF86 family)